MKRLDWVLAIVLTLSGLWAQNAGAAQAGPAADFLKGVAAYEAGNFSEAATAFQKAADAGVVNPKLFYNLGCAYFKTGDLGRAVLWYLRAQKLMPHDPDLGFNLAHALSRVKDEPPPGPGPVLQVALFWKPLLGRNGVKWAAVILFALIWLALAVSVFWPRPALKTAAVTLAAPALILLATALFDFYRDARHEQAVVIPSEIQVKSGLTDDTTTLFLLHAGTKVRIQNQRNGRVLIQYTGDKRGWVPKDAVEAI